MTNAVLRVTLSPLLFLTFLFSLFIGLNRSLSFGAQVALFGGLIVGVTKIVADGFGFLFFLLLVFHNYLGVSL